MPTATPAVFRPPTGWVPRPTFAAGSTATSFTATAGTPLNICSNDPGHVFLSPSDGSISNGDGDIIGIAINPVSAPEFDASVKFFNPSVSNFDSWSYGFLFRRSVSGDQDAFFIDNFRSWTHKFHRAGEEGWTDISRGGIGVFSDVIFNTRVRESNVIRLIAEGRFGKVFINGTFLTDLTLDKPSETRTGIVPAFGPFRGAAAGELDYEDFTVTCP